MTPDKPNKSGKPLRFKTVEELQVAIEDYFNYCDSRIKQIYTKEGLKLLLHMQRPHNVWPCYCTWDRQTDLLDYAHRDEYLPTVKAARNKVEQDVETRLMETQNQSGAIFNLKNNFGWKDKTEQDITSADYQCRLWDLYMYSQTTAYKKIASLDKRIRVIQGGTSAGKTIAILLYLIMQPD